MINPYFFTNENLKICFKLNLESHNINPAISILTITPIYPYFCIETRYISRILKEMATIYAGLVKRFMFEYHKKFSASL